MQDRIVELKAASQVKQCYVPLTYDQIREESVRKAEEIRQATRLNDLMQKIPMRFRSKTFVDYLTEGEAQAHIKKIAERYVLTFKDRLKEGGNLIFKGKPGTGKTLLSLIIYQALAKYGYNVRYESSLEFVRALVEEKFKSQSAFSAHLQGFNRIDFLIIDEVTESISKDGAPTEIEKKVLFQLINQRYENNLCTLIITNRNHDELINRLGLPVVDRLLENGMSFLFNWNSYRQK